ncbi:MAG TPA: methyl-accepting chemotaxis protein [Thermoanaerobaculia bacterium]|jgi:methyl-accepting chemotaxis protein|nr:methyl-accepting chemotaxis protein [Thermoanaerobaculia bacterium]
MTEEGIEEELLLNQTHRRASSETEAEPRAAFGAFALLASASAAGVVLLAIGLAFGASAWPLAAFTLVAGAALALLAGRRGVFSRSAAGVAGVADLGSIPAEHAAASAALSELRAGDLVAAAEARPDLAPRVRAAIATAADGLATLAEQLRSVNGETATATDGVVRMTAELASSSSELSASVTEITAAMEELARTASGISERAITQVELATRVEARGAAGEDALVEAVAGVAEVEARIAAIAERTDALGARSKEIYRVLDLIAEIAQETHVLSLNAAIEAAAAGVEGRRIAVVAEEVRRLASRSRDSVASVRALLDEFSASIRGTVVATEEGAKETRRVLGSAERAAVAVADLRAVGGETSARAGKISGATREQDAASDEVVATLRDVLYVVERTSAALAGLDATQRRLERLVLGVELLAQGLRRDSSTSLVHLAQGWGERLAGPDSTAEAYQRALDELLVEAPYLDDAYLVDAKGYALFLGSRRRPADAPAAADGRAAEGPEHGDRDLSGRPWFRAVVARGRTVLTAPYVSVNGRTCFTVAVPAFQPTGELRSVLGVDVDVHNWTRIGAPS